MEGMGKEEGIWNDSSLINLKKWTNLCLKVGWPVTIPINIDLLRLEIIPNSD